MTSISSLRKSSHSNIDRLNKELEKLTAPKSNNTVDERFWKPELDKAGNGYAVFRFLTAPKVDGEDALPWVRMFDHGFQGPGGKWYIENSLTTIGQPDPVSEYNSKLWNTGLESNKEIARKQKRRLHYISNIEMIDDSKNPQNNGKVFLFKFGKKIFDKVEEAMNPQFADEKAINPFDFWNGANFKLKVRKVEGYTNYDKSEFEKASEHHGGDEKILDKIWESEYSLTEFLAPKNFKSYDELKTRLEGVLNGEAPATAVSQSSNSQQAKAPVQSTKSTVERTKVVEPEDDMDDDLKRFAALAGED